MWAPRRIRPDFRSTTAPPRARSGPDSLPLDPTCPSQRKLAKMGHGQRYDINVRGGSDDLTYFLSTGYSKETGDINGRTTAPRTSTSVANFQFNGFEDLQIRLNSSYRRQDIDWLPQGTAGRDSC